MSVLKDLIKKQWREVKQEMKEFLRSSHGSDEEKNLLNDFLDEISEDSILTNSESTFKTIKTVHNIESQIDMLLQYNGSATVKRLHSSNTMVSKIKEKLKVLTIHLWQYLSQLARLDEWSLKGSIGTGGGVFGFSGNIELGLSFRT